jgi:hypothetical protein
VPCVIIPAETPVEKLGAYTILDNNGFGKWDWDLLANEWDKGMLEDWGFDWDMDGYGFEEEAKEAEKNNTHEDDYDEEKDETPCRCCAGDIWLLGEHRLMCGDSTDSECVRMLMGGRKLICG